jgi:hypothetical protein
MLFYIILDPQINSAPSENVVVKLGKTTLENFTCIANPGSSALWIFNGSLEDHHDKQIFDSYKEIGVIFYPDRTESSKNIISVGIGVTSARHNNTQLSCFAINTSNGRNSTSSAVTLTIAG